MTQKVQTSKFVDATPIGETPVKVELPYGFEVECLVGKLWLSIRPADQKEFVDDKYLVPGERYTASQDLVVWVSSFNANTAEFKVNNQASPQAIRASCFARERTGSK